MENEVQKVRNQMQTKLERSEVPLYGCYNDVVDKLKQKSKANEV